MCDAIMYLDKFKTDFGECQMKFECPACGNACGRELVWEERTALRHGGSIEHLEIWLHPPDAIST